MGTLKDKKYIHIPNFLTKEELNLIQPYCKNLTLNGPSFDLQSPFSPSFHKDVIIEGLLESKKELIENISGLELDSTYSFWRSYVHGATIEDYKDQTYYEVGVVVNLDNCGTVWPIPTETDCTNIKVGEAVVYLGHEVMKERKAFEGRYNVEGYLHYVDKNSSFSNFKGDK